MHPLPKIRDSENDLTYDCCKKSGGLKELDGIHRTLPDKIVNTFDQDVIQDEDGFAILTAAGESILDNLKNEPKAL